jgi:hypothetical protein
VLTKIAVDLPVFSPLPYSWFVGFETVLVLMVDCCGRSVDYFMMLHVYRISFNLYLAFYQRPGRKTMVCNGHTIRIMHAKATLLILDLMCAA